MDDFAERFKNTSDDFVIVNSDWSVVRLSASLLAQVSAAEIRRSLRQIYAAKYAKKPLYDRAN